MSLNTAFAPSSFRVFSSIPFLLLLLILATPRITAAQGTSEEPTQEREDPLTLPPPIGSGKALGAGAPGARTLLCKATAHRMACADEIGLGERVRAVAGTEARVYTFALATHETVRLETFGEAGTRGALFDGDGRRVAAEDGGDGGDFRIVRTLSPGRYHAVVATRDAEAGYELRVAATTPRGWTGAPAGHDVGNHCGRARATATDGVVEGRFERPGDVDVFAVELAVSGDLRIAAEGPARYELKAADCATSIGLADGAPGATVSRLPAGSYYLYVSEPRRARGEYRLHLDFD